FSFGQKDDYIARGVLKTAHALNKGLLLPAGSELRIMSYGTLRVYAPGPTVTLSGLPIRSGTATPIDFYCGSPQGLFLGQFQLAEDRVINGIPCKAKAVEEWNVSTELYENGNVHRATLASATTIDGIAFLPDEIIKLGWDGELESATILSSRNIAGKAVVAYQSGDPAKGLWSGSRPNLYMSKGVLVSCYQENFMVGKTVINAINLYHYSADGKTLSGMTVLSPYFLGYPVSLGKSLYPWEWEVSQSDILFSGSTASFTIDAGLALNGKRTSQLLEAGTKLIIDTAGFFCIHAELPDGQSFRWTKADAMKAPLLEGEQLYLQIATWMEQWLKANPENPSDDSRTRLVLSHASILNSAKAELTLIQHSKFILEILGDILVYKKKGGPLAPGSVGLDMNGNKRLEGSELVPSFASTAGAKLFSPEEILAYLLEHGIGALPKQSLVAMGETMAKAQPFAWRSDSLGILDSLGSTLSSLGVHPFADRKIYYFPNGSGDKMLCDTIEFYPSGMPSLLTIDSSELGANDVGGTNETVSFTVPGGSKARVWLYAQHRVQRAKDHAQDEAFWASAGIAQWYWSQINVVRFHESGQI
ncbi:MAG TPA: hypothetical protein PLC54_02700, partial [Spirochaetales bacterium]|nr:hypothetical protein [Spirochaetales bacterium]